MLVSIRHASMTVSSSSSSVSVRQQRWFLHPIPPPQRFVAVVAFTLQLLLIIHWNHNDGNISNHMFLTTTDAFVTTTTPFSYSKITTTTRIGRNGNLGAFPPTMTRHGLFNSIVPWPQQQRHHYYHSLHRATKIQSSAVVDNNDDSNNGNTVVPTTKFTILMRQISKTLSRTSWISWWSQVILTVISSIILLFAKSISSAGTTAGRGSFVSSGIGILISTISILWTWGNGTRLSQRLLRATMVVADDPVTTTLPFVSSPKKKTTTTTTTTTISNMIQRAITIGVVINCIGLLCNLLAAQQIIGIFAIKVFTSSSSTTSRVLGTTASSLFSDTLQPLDILIIQANTNVLLSQYISLVALLSLIPNMLQKIHRYQHQDEEEDRTVTQKTTTSSTTTTTIVNDDE